MLYATLPPPQSAQMPVVAKEPLVEGVRFNTGTRTPYCPRECLQILKNATRDKEFWIDLKCRQPRIIKWADPTFSDIELNHEVTVDLPAKIIFRGEHATNIVAVNGNKVFVDPRPKHVVGAGQAVNILGSNLKIEGFFIDSDLEYINAGIELGIHRYMLSYVEQESDIAQMIERDPQAIIVAKIETQKGLEFVRDVYPSFSGSIRLLAAMDDLYTNIGPDETEMIPALKTIISADPNAIAASRLFLSLEDNETMSLQDQAFFRFLEAMGYNSFMLSDDLCKHPDPFARTIEAMRKLGAKEKPRGVFEGVRSYLEGIKLWG
jgi:hypothetical protein